MPTVLDLPNELLDMVMGYVDNPTFLHTLLFHRKLIQSARKAIYDNLRITVWDHASLSVKDAQGNAREIERHMYRKLLAIMRFVNLLKGSPLLLQRTSTVTIKLSESDQMFLKTTCRPTKLKTDFLNALDPAIWDKLVTNILKRTSRAKRITIDWLDEMPLLFAQSSPKTSFTTCVP